VGDSSPSPSGSATGLYYIRLVGSAEYTVLVVEDAVFVEYVRATQLDVLCHCAVRAPDTSQTFLDVVHQTLGHQRIFVQVHQVRRLQQRTRVKRSH